MIEHVTTTAGDEYAIACDRARASVRRRGAAERSTAWPAFVPPVALSEGPLGAVQAADREIGRQTALRARAVAEFAATRPADADRAQGEPGAMSPERWAARPDVLRGVSEWAGQELVIALGIGSEAADALLTRSLNLVHRLPGTLAAVEAGALHPGHLWSMLEKVAPIEDDEVRAEVEAELLRWAAGRVISPAQLGAKVRREVARRDARAAARQLEKAIRERGVHLRPEPTDGMAAVVSLFTVPEALAFHRALGHYADAIPDDPDSPPRTRGQKMADCLLDLVLRPGESEMPPVQLVLTAVASVATLAGGDDPGEIDGHVVPAELIRELVRMFAPGQVSMPPLPAADGAFPAVVLLESGGSDPTAGPPNLCWEQAEQEELERWWDEVERRVLAEEFGAGPEGEPVATAYPSSDDPAPDDPVPDDPALDDPALDDPALDDPPPDAPRPDESHPSNNSVPDGPPPDSPPDGPPPDDGAWWRVADDAVGEAGQAVRLAGEALSRARQTVRTASAADAADEAAWQARSGRFTNAGDALAALRAATQAQRASLADLLLMTGGGGMAERPRIALTDAASGALLALTDLPELRRVGTCGAAACRRDPGRCDHDLAGRPGLGPPGPVGGYRPSAALDRFVRARDRRCRFPGCRRRVPRGGELDHDRPWPDGETSAANLAGYCTSHHRGKHQAPGWRHALGADGTLVVITPTGLVAVTEPPPY